MSRRIKGVVGTLVATFATASLLIAPGQASGALRCEIAAAQCR